MILKWIYLVLAMDNYTFYKERRETVADNHMISYKGIEIPWWDMFDLYKKARLKRNALLRVNGISLRVWNSRMRSGWTPLGAATTPESYSIWSYTIRNKDNEIVLDDIHSQGQIIEFLCKSTGAVMQTGYISKRFARSNSNTIHVRDYWIERKCTKR